MREIFMRIQKTNELYMMKEKLCELFELNDYENINTELDLKVGEAIAAIDNVINYIL